MNNKRIIHDFWFGLIIGLLAALVISLLIGGLIYVRHIKKEQDIYVEKQIEINELREEIINRDVNEFLDIPAVRRAADGAAGDFEQRKNEILFRFRNRLIDK